MKLSLLKINYFLALSLILSLLIVIVTTAEPLTYNGYSGSNLGVEKSLVTTRTVIPVAFHIIKKTDGTGEISNELINDQIYRVAVAFAYSNFSFIVYSIDRTTNDSWASATHNSTEDSEMKNALAVDPAHILNIYSIVSDEAGYSSFPWEYPESSKMHGVVINYATLPDGTYPNYGQGDVCIHEVGHYTGLLHTFENCISGDEVDDTPPQQRQTDPNSPCGTYILNCPNSTGNFLANNYMDYSADECRTGFTYGQNERINEKMAQFKPSMHGFYVTVEQRRNSGDLMNGSTIGRWDNEVQVFQNITIPAQPFYAETNNIEVLRGSQTLVTNPNEKYNLWAIGDADDQDVRNHRSFSMYEEALILTSKFNLSYSNITIQNLLEGCGFGGELYFKDPWYIDSVDAQHGNNLMNRGMTNTKWWKRYPTVANPFCPDYSTTFQINDEQAQSYKGVFLNQGGVPPNLTPPFYSVKIDAEQIITLAGGEHKFYFQNWSYDPAKISLQYPSSNQTGVVFKSPDQTTLTANLKGQLVSSESNGFSSNGQRKIVRDNSGYYHCVYSSLGKVWYTKSTTTNFDGTWTQDTEVFSDISTGSVNPSIDVNGNEYAVVGELQDGSTSVISLFRSETSSLDEVATIDNSYYGSSYPVISKTNNEYFIIYKPSATSNLKFRRYYATSLPPYTWLWSPEADLPYSTSDSKYPSIVGDKSDDGVYIVWQEGTAEIKYLFSNRQGNLRVFDTAESVSENSGYTINTNPSISLSEIGEIISWTGGRKEKVAYKMLGKETASFVYVHRALIRAKAGTWGDFTVLGSEVNYTNNNSSESLTGETVIAFSQSGGTASKWVKRVGGYYSAVSSLSHNGLQVNVSNGTDLTNVEAMVFNTASLPYPINRSTTSFTSLSKIASDTTVTYGRTGVVGKQGMEFLFCVEDILLDNENIKFIERVDTLPVLNLNELNSAARTNTFNLTGNSNLYFSLYYLVINPELASSVLTNEDYVNFKLELVNADNNMVAGTFDDITFTKQNVNDHESISYKIDCAGIAEDITT